MAPHSSTLPWKIPWTEEPRRLLSMGSLWVRHDWATSLSLFTFMHWRRTWQPTPTSLPGKLQERGTWWAAVYGVAQSWTRLKWQLLLQQQQPSRGLHMSIWTLYISSSAILRRHWTDTDHAQREVLISSLCLFHTWSPWLCHHELVSLPMFSQRWVNTGYLAHKVW